MIEVFPRFRRLEDMFGLPDSVGPLGPRERTGEPIAESDDESASPTNDGAGVSLTESEAPVPSSAPGSGPKDNDVPLASGKASCCCDAEDEDSSSDASACMSASLSREFDPPWQGHRRLPKGSVCLLRAS